MHPHFARNLAKSLRVGRRLVDAGDAKLTRVAPVDRSPEPDHRSRLQVLGLGQLARDEDLVDGGISVSRRDGDEQ